jgi:hypothetical protein
VVGEGLGDFLAEELAVTFPEPVNCGAEGAFGKVEVGCGEGVWDGPGGDGEERFHGLEERAFAGGVAFITQPGDDPFKESEGPFAVEETVGGSGVGGFELVAELGILPIEREMGGGAAAFLALGLVPFVGEEVFEAGEEEGAKLTPLGVEVFEVVPGEETDEEGLDEILGLRFGVALAPDISVERKPVSLAQLSECLVGLGRGLTSSGDHDCPAGGDERVAGVARVVAEGGGGHIGVRVYKRIGAG